MYYNLLAKNVSLTISLHEYPYPVILARALRLERRRIVLETIMLPLHHARLSGAPWNRTTMIPASTGCNRTISAKAPGSLYEIRTHATGSKDQRPNQLGEQTVCG
jgi:hypothetical protein